MVDSKKFLSTVFTKFCRPVKFIVTLSVKHLELLKEDLVWNIEYQVCPLESLETNVRIAREQVTNFVELLVASRKPRTKVRVYNLML
ncbi:hypothetical protein M8J77_019278 [Diaphorina citri]|nr:hypothetical protein M8J77_019278 [Diaphorina citri]